MGMKLVIARQGVPFTAAWGMRRDILFCGKPQARLHRTWFSDRVMPVREHDVPGCSGTDSIVYRARLYCGDRVVGVRCYRYDLTVCRAWTLR